MLCRALRVTTALSLVLVLASCAEDEEPPSPKPPSAPIAGGDALLRIDFDSAPSDGSPLKKIDLEAGGGKAEVIATGNGEITGTRDLNDGTAVIFPSSSAASSDHLAAIKVTIEETEGLAPGDSDFQFGADVMYPEGAAGDSAVDDGDNVIQRGLFADPGQYKLQVDHGIPACRLAGVRGEVLVKAKQTLEAGEWYRLVCQRADDEVTFFMAELEEGQTGPDADLDWSSWSSPDLAGGITASDATVPVAIGGKLNPEGGIVVNAPDQFSGVMDNVHITSLP